jgi:hypothetical protein
MELASERIDDFPTHFPGGTISAPDQWRPGTKHAYSIQLAQATFLELLVAEASRYPSFKLMRRARVEQLIKDNGRVVGVRFRDAESWRELSAQPVVGADGRFSRVRQLAGMHLRTTPRPFDVPWFTLPRLAADPPRARGLYLGQGQLAIVMDRTDVWCAARSGDDGRAPHRPGRRARAVGSQPECAGSISGTSASTTGRRRGQLVHRTSAPRRRAVGDSIARWVAGVRCSAEGARRGPLCREGCADPDDDAALATFIQLATSTATRPRSSVPGGRPICSEPPHVRGLYVEVVDPALSSHRITSVALLRTDGGTTYPSIWAASRLITNSTSVGGSLGRSAGLAPCRICATYSAARRPLLASTGA